MSTSHLAQMLVRGVWFPMKWAIMIFAILFCGFALLGWLHSKHPSQIVVDVPFDRMRFQIPNAYLVFPVSQPDELVRQKEEGAKKLWAYDGRKPPNFSGFSLKFDLPDLSPGTLKRDRRVIATVEYNWGEPVSHVSLAQAVDRVDWNLVEEPSFDTARYVAFWMKPTDTELKRAAALHLRNDVTNEVIEYRYISRDGASPQIVDCLFAKKPAPDGDPDCHVTVPFLADRYGNLADGQPRYKISLSFPLSQIDNLPMIIDKVNAKLHGFLVP